MEKKLYRDEQHKAIGGVCAGLAEYFNVDTSIVRVIFLLALILKGVGFLPYIILWIVIPKRPFGYQNPFKPGVTPGYGPNYGQPTYGDVKVDYTVPPVNQPGQPFMFQPPKKSNAGVIFGVILIVLGSIFLIDNFDFIPELDFELLWPVVLVAAGLAIIFSGKKKPWEQQSFNEQDKAASNNTVDTDYTANDKQNDNTQNI
ncbi:PspC domain-containing protein [Mucilaginibacter litoreus]|uniref:PspC domain-containing protein n=1 Tax=Mucilaginibacter litoreus TaxID=1048221 RepID=A0ABW3AQL8_9SPHI